VAARGKLRPDNQRERPWANAVAWTARAAGVRTPTAKAVIVEVHCFFQRPKKPTHPFPSRSDVDKLARSVLDALTGIAWLDDQQVVDLRVTKSYAEDNRIGANVRITEAP
jgi:Holliday junction resolvase RusA-like endonuclease